MKVVLFDIDGTILLSDGAGKRAINSALLEIFGTVGPGDYWFDGKTDRQIVREMMRAEGFDDELIDQRMDALLDLYLEHLARELQSPAHFPKLFAGVPELLDSLEEREDVVLGLLTGNLEKGAHSKLQRVGVDPRRFRLGAFGSDHEHRTELPGIAHARAMQFLKADIHGSAVVVIGDTPADILCGRGIGARAIGVATGRFSIEQLSEYSPAAVFQDLCATDAVVKAICDD